MMIYSTICRISIIRINLKYLLIWIFYLSKKDKNEILKIIETLRIYQMESLHRFILKFSSGKMLTYLEQNISSDLFCYYIEKDLLQNKLAKHITFSKEQIMAISKYWEKPSTTSSEIHSKLNDLLSTNKLKVLNISNYSNLPKVAKKWKVSPPKIIHSDRKRNYLGRKTYELESRDAGLVHLKEVFGIAGSNSFLMENGIFVDEFREIYPPDCDTRNEPFIRGVKKSEVIVDLNSIEESSAKVIPAAFWLAGPFIGEWGHFVNTYLIKFLHYISVNDLQKVPILIPDNLPENIKEILGKLDHSNQIVKISSLDKFFIEDCYYFPSTVFAPTNAREFKKRIQSNVYVDPEKFLEMFQVIRKNFNLNSTQIFPKRILWARPNLSRRVLKNQTEFEEIVGEFGFKSFDPLSAGTFDQLQVLYNAEYICGEIGSWIYLAGLNPSTKIIVVMSDWDQHWWNEIGSLNKNLIHPIIVLLGKRINLDDYKSENAPHGEYELSSKALSKLGTFLKKQLQ